jgi:hypothetical protein
LMSKLVGDNVGNPVAVAVGGSLFVEEHSSRSMFREVSTLFDLKHQCGLTGR